MKKIITIIVFIICGLSVSTAQPITVGLLKHSPGSNDNGYVLFAPLIDSTTYLIDKCGYLVHKWEGKCRPALSVYLLPNGKLLRTAEDKTTTFRNGGGGGYLQILDWDGNVEWSYKISTSTECQHHDVKYLPNGNILAIVYDKKNIEEEILAGRNTEMYSKDVWSEKIKELRPIGHDSAEVVWEWSLWDHLVQQYDKEKANYGIVKDYPELMDINFNAINQVDWLHLNSIDYNPDLDQILVCSPNINEIWVIDHSTTTAEAASHEGGRYGKGGDLLYRWGNPQVYQQGKPEDQKLFGQHDATWIKNNSKYSDCLMIFNNCNGDLVQKYSSVDIIKPPIDSEGFYQSIPPYLPTNTVWSYVAPNPSDFFATNLSGAQILENGNVLICNGVYGFFFEIDTTKNRVWEYMNPVAYNGILTQGSKPMLTNSAFRCTFYPNDFPGFFGKDLSQKGIIENTNSNSDGCTLFLDVAENNVEIKTYLYPNPTNNFLYIETEEKDFKIEIYDNTGKKRLSEENLRSIDTNGFENGTYYANVISKINQSKQIYKFIIRR